jgi:tetratricopeptide (TPR) repeat protein
MEFRELGGKLTSLLALADDAPYFPIDAYEERRWPFLLRGTTLVLLAVLVHWQGVHFQWIWTDYALISENPLLRSDRGMLQFWLHPFTGGGGPLGGTLLYLQYTIFSAGSARYYHVVSLLAHAGNCLLIWAILRRLGAPGAWLAAAIFAVHPIEVQSISWASHQADVLAALAGLTSLICFLAYQQIHPPAPADFAVKPPAKLRLRIFMSGLFLIAALLQPTIVMLAGVFPLILWWKRGKVDREDWMELAPVLAVAGLIVCIGLFASEYRHAGGPAAALNVLDRLIMTGRAAWFYVECILWPHPLLFVYPRWDVTGDLWMLFFPLALGAGLETLFEKRALVGKGVVVGVWAFLLLMLPHLPLVRSEWMQFSFVADHLQYLPGVPLIALAAAGVSRLMDLTTSALPRRGIRLTGGTLIILGLATLTVLQTRTYASELAPWQYTLEYDPMSLTARGVMADYYTQHGTAIGADLFPPAFLDRVESLKSHGGPDAGATIFEELKRASILESGQHYSDAIQIYEQLLRVDPKNREAGIHLAIAYKNRGDIAKALHSFADAEQRNPGDEALLNEYGLALVQSGQVTDGIEKYRAAIRIDPRFVAARLNLSNALFAQGNYREAAEQLHIAAVIDPRSFEAFMNAGVMLVTLRNYQSAERMFEAAVQLRPDSALARDDLGVTLAQQGFLDEAVDSFTQAVKLQPDFHEAREHLARAKQERDAKLR